eukprot:TRINITY_DN1936_c0_g1_i1.p1 TRINITY_DN1936_c0_g1~~TRINITY_DN1936_c0_g1_i1.p1  ORF type:complete len:1078 (+),score=311.44 TRINITY_DN1936_c0_g1_i1:181-3414(+)
MSKKTYTCKKCKADLPTIGQLFSHEPKCTGSPPTTQTTPINSSIPTRTITNNIPTTNITTNGPSNVKCTKCNMSFSTFGQKFTHESNCKGLSSILNRPIQPTPIQTSPIKNTPIQQSNTIKCVKCSTTFLTFGEKFSHESNCNGNPPTSQPIKPIIKCSCGTTFLSYGELYSHESICGKLIIPKPSPVQTLPTITTPFKTTPVKTVPELAPKKEKKPQKVTETKPNNVKKELKPKLSNRDRSLITRGLDARSHAIFVHLGSLLKDGIKHPLTHQLIYNEIKDKKMGIVFFNFNRNLAESAKCNCCQTNMKKIKYTQFEGKVYLKCKVTVQDVLDACGTNLYPNQKRCIIYDSDQIKNKKELESLEKMSGFTLIDLSSQKSSIQENSENKFYVEQRSNTPFTLDDCLNLLNKTKKDFQRKVFTIEQDYRSSFRRIDYDDQFKESEHLDRIVEKTKQWIEKQTGLPKAKQTFKNSILPICIVKENIKGQLVVDKLLEQKWIKKCLVCSHYDYTLLKESHQKKANNFLFSWERPSKKSLLSDQISDTASSEVETIFEKIVYWSKTEPNLPSNITAVANQLSSFQLKRIIDPENVIKVLSEEKIVIVDPYEFSDILILKHGQEVPDYWLIDQSKKANKISSSHTSNVIPQYSKEKFHSLKENSDFFSHLSHKIQLSFEEAGFDTMTEIQNEVFPAIVTGKHTVFQSFGGSGKTGAYLIPIVERLERQNTIEKERMEKKICRVVVLTSSLHLCSQIESEFKKISSKTNLRCYVAKGETHLGEDSSIIRSGEVDVVISVPSVVRELICRSIIKTKDVFHCIVDESDLLISNLFLEDFKEVLSSLLIHQNQRFCQFIFSSTTLHRVKKNRIKDLMKEICKDNLSFASETSSNSEERSEFESSDNLYEYSLAEKNELISREISHLNVITKQTEKVKVIQSILDKDVTSIVYVSSLSQAKHIHNALSKSENISKVGLFNEKLKSSQQKEIIDSFKSKKLSMIISSGHGFFERGFDFSDINLVVNFDLPPTTEDYVNRSGRVSRISNSRGCSLTLLIDGEDRYLERLTNTLDVDCQTVSADVIFDFL